MANHHAQRDPHLLHQQTDQAQSRLRGYNFQRHYQLQLSLEVDHLQVNLSCNHQQA
uniref:Uncharacterized protein n=1 Tax=Arundo donax TaxID=35708 RepID=A0A0A9HNN2_ARUDO